MRVQNHSLAGIALIVLLLNSGCIKGWINSQSSNARSPSSPPQLSIVAKAGSNDLSWISTMGSTASDTKFQVFRRIGTNAETLVAHDITGNSYIDRDVIGGTEYEYRIGLNPTPSADNSLARVHAVAVYSFRQFIVTNYNASRSTGNPGSASTGSKCLTLTPLNSTIKVGQFINSSASTVAAGTKVAAIPGSCGTSQIELTKNALMSQSDSFDFYDSQLLTYRVQDGVLTSSGVSSSARPISNIVSSSNGKFVIGISNLGLTTAGIDVYQMAPTGQLTLLPAKSVEFSGLSGWAQIAKVAKIGDKDFIYIVDTYNNQIFAFQLDAVTGNVTQVSGSPYFVNGITVASGATSPFGGPIGDGSRFACGPYDVTFAGEYLFVGCGQYGQVGAEGVAGFHINQSTGGLTGLVGSPWASSPGGGANSIASSADGTRLYLLNGANGGYGPAGIDLFSVGAGGIPNLISPLGAPLTFTGSDNAFFWGVFSPVSNTIYGVTSSNTLGIVPIVMNSPASAASSLASGMGGVIKLNRHEDLIAINGPGLQVYSLSASSSSPTQLSPGPLVLQVSSDFDFVGLLY